MSAFLQIPKITYIGGRYPWRLETPLIYQSDYHSGLIIVPETYTTDFTTVPRIPFIHAVAAGRGEMPAVIHDYLYDCWNDRVSRLDADKIFLEAMGVINNPSSRFTRWLMYRGVRLGGLFAWHRDSTDKCPCKQNGAGDD